MLLPAQSHPARQRESLGSSLLVDSGLCFYPLPPLPLPPSLAEIKHPPGPQSLLTRGRRKPLRLLPGVQPKGSDSPSSYSAGSQRARAVLEAPSQGLFLQRWVRSGQQGSGVETIQRLGRGGEGRRLPRGRGSPSLPPVITSPRDGSVLVAALLFLLLGSTATGLGQQPQLGFRQHIWG